MDTSTPDLEHADLANELYWGSSASVNQIADQLDLSKGSLYALIRPLPSDILCPRCSTELAYPNRTAREKSFVSCPACDYQADEETASSAGGLVPADFARGEAGGSVASSRAGSHRPLTINRAVLGTACLGIAAGLALALWARRR